MLSIVMNPTKEVLIGLMFLASVRVYLEIIGFDFLNLPLTKSLTKYSSERRLIKFHKMGLIFSIGYIFIYVDTEIRI